MSSPKVGDDKTSRVNVSKGPTLLFSDSYSVTSSENSSDNSLPMVGEERQRQDPFHVETPVPKYESPRIIRSEDCRFRFLDRYREWKTGPSARAEATQSQTIHYSVHRKYVRRSGLKRKLFQMTDKTGVVLCGAEFASLTSSVIRVSNDKGLICEIDARTHFTMRLGRDPYLVMSVGKDKEIRAEFMECDGMMPRYRVLTSPANSCRDLVQAFGSRRTMRSVKNCKLCNDSVEVVSVRKVRPNTLEIDAKCDVSFLSCFVIGIFMFLRK
jgi:hypothetical protein